MTDDIGTNTVRFGDNLDAAVLEPLDGLRDRVFHVEAGGAHPCPDLRLEFGRFGMVIDQDRQTGEHGQGLAVVPFGHRLA